MESRFGHNFSTILIHKSPTAAALSTQPECQAFTIANHIVFGEGEFQQESFAGQHLLLMTNSCRSARYGCWSKKSTIPDLATETLCHQKIGSNGGKSGRQA
jgi:hypothetical protein